MDNQDRRGSPQRSTGAASSRHEWQEASEPWSMQSWTHANSLERIEILGWDEA